MLLTFTDFTPDFTTALSTIFAVSVVTGWLGLGFFGLSFWKVIVGPLVPAGCASIVDVLHCGSAHVAKPVGSVLSSGSLPTYV